MRINKLLVNMIIKNKKPKKLPKLFKIIVKNLISIIKKKFEIGELF